MRSSLFLVLILKVKYEATLRDYPEQYVQECCEGPVEPTTTVGVESPLRAQNFANPPRFLKVFFTLKKDLKNNNTCGNFS
jgi:hypothetical protein